MFQRKLQFMQMRENVQREDVHPLNEARGFKHNLESDKNITTSGLCVEVRKVWNVHRATHDVEWIICASTEPSIILLYWVVCKLHDKFNCPQFKRYASHLENQACLWLDTWRLISLSSLLETNLFSLPRSEIHNYDRSTLSALEVNRYDHFQI